jgi:hypothetical protein
LAAATVALAVAGAWPAWFEAEARVRQYRARVVRCDSTASSLFSGGVRRDRVRIMNLGNATVFVGQAGGTADALTTANGWPIHAGALAANIELSDTDAGMDCLTTDTNSVEVGVLEELGQ